MWKGGAWLQVLQFVRPPRLCLAAGLRQPPSEGGAGGARARLPTLLLFGVRSQSAYRGFVFVRRFVLLRQFVWRALPLPPASEGGGGQKALGLNIFSWIGTATAFEATVYWFESNRMLNYFIYFIKAGVPKKKSRLFQPPTVEPLSASTHFKNLKALFLFVLRSRVPWLSRLRLLPARCLFNNGLRSQR